MLDKIDPSYLLGCIVNPLSLYFLCNHYIATEITRGSKDYIKYKCKINIPHGINNLLQNHNYNMIKEFDTILIQADYLDFFYNKIFPSLQKKIIIFTCQYKSFTLKQSKLTDEILHSPNILLWISQYPIYNNHEKYMLFPLGIDIKHLSLYYCFLVGYFNDCKDHEREDKKCYREKSRNIFNNNIKYSIFEEEIGNIDFYNKLSQSRYIINLSPNNIDCHANYEAIGLGCIPISNLLSNYKNLYDTNICFKSVEDIDIILQTNNIDHTYTVPNREIILSSYWNNKIIERIKKII